MTTPRIGLALSGGGFRATCFGLGCLRALHDQDLLRHVSVISGISGGSVLAALYAYGPAEFGEFDTLVVDQLRRGLQLEIVARALRPGAAVRNLAHATRAALMRRTGEPVLRGANRTSALRDTLAARAFGDRLLDQVTYHGLATVITATDLRTSNAVRFGSLRSSCSVYGTIQEPVQVADAVAASGAFPLLLPAVERAYTFRRQPADAPERHAVLLTDGGIYDNLGLSVLQPGRSSAQTPHVVRRRLHHRLRRRPGPAPAGQRPLRDVPHEAQFQRDLPARPRRIPWTSPRGRRHRAHPRVRPLLLGHARCSSPHAGGGSRSRRRRPAISHKFPIDVPVRARCHQPPR